MADMLDSFAPDVDFNAEPEAPEPEIAAPEPQLDVKEPEVKEAPKEEPKEEPKHEPEKVKVVPYGALHEERMRRKEVEREWADYKAKIEARLEKITNPPPVVPKFEEDPAGHLQHEITATKAELATLRQSSEETRKQHEAVEFERQIATSTQAAEQVFSKEHPDYLQAVQHLQNIADKNLQMMGVDDPAERQAQIRKDALAMSLKALQMNKSPAEVAYQLAVNYGYKATQEQPKGTEAAKKIATLQEGQKAAAAMPNGGTKQASLTLAALEQMDDDEFNKLVEDDAAWKKLVRQMQ